MCLIAFAIGASPDWPLVVAANRDERWDRPTLPLQAWQLPSGKTVWSGRDLQAGGTWLGLAEGGRVAMLTNVRSGPPELAPRSRGELVTDWLDSDEGCADRAPDTPSAPAAAGSASHALPDGWGQLAPGWQGHQLEPGLYGLSNAALDTPWPKTVALKQALQQHLGQDSLLDAADQLLGALLQMPAAPDDELPATGIPIEVERQLSSPFVHAPDWAYGTRSSLLVHAHADGQILLQEWTHSPQPLAPDLQARHWPLQLSRRRQLAL